MEWGSWGSSISSMWQAELGNPLVPWSSRNAAALLRGWSSSQEAAFPFWPGERPFWEEWNQLWHCFEHEVGKLSLLPTGSNLWSCEQPPNGSQANAYYKMALESEREIKDLEKHFSNTDIVRLSHNNTAWKNKCWTTSAEPQFDLRMACRLLIFTVGKDCCFRSLSKGIACS